MFNVRYTVRNTNYMISSDDVSTKLFVEKITVTPVDFHASPLFKFIITPNNNIMRVCASIFSII